MVPGRVWRVARPVWFSGVKLRTHATVVKLDDGGLWVHGPPPPTEPIRAALDALGPVRWAVVPNLFHHVAAPAFAAAYPEATLIGPDAIRAKNPAVQPAVSAAERVVKELEPHPLEGVPLLDETLFFHHPTRTLIGTDVVMTACAADHWTWRAAGRITGCWNRVRPPPDVRWKTPRSEAAARSIERLAALPMDRLLVAHADPIEERPADQLRDAWAYQRR